MTVGMLRRIIRETIEEETRHSVNEGFMDSVKGMFGGGTKGAAKMYRKKLYDMFPPSKYEGSSRSDWWEMNQGINEDFGSRIHEKFEDILRSSDGESCAGFYDAFLRAISQLLNDPATLVGKGGGMFEDTLLAGAEALEKGDMKAAKNNLQQLLGRQAGVVWEAFKAEPLAEPYLAAAEEASDREQRINRGAKIDKDHEAWKKKKEKEAEEAELERERGNRRQAKASEKEARLDRGAELSFNDARRKGQEKNWGKETSNRYAD